MILSNFMSFAPGTKSFSKTETYRECASFVAHKEAFRSDEYVLSSAKAKAHAKI